MRNTLSTVSDRPELARQKMSQKRRTQIGVILAFTIIPLGLLLLFTYFPFMEMVKFSFFKMKYIGKRTFVGWANYKEIFTRDDTRKSLLLSLYYMAGALIQVVVGLYLATILSFKVKGGKFFKGSLFFPFLINGIAIGFIFKFFYTRGFVLDTVLQAIGFNLDNLPYWLKDQSINNWSLVYSSIWRYLGQNVVLFVGAIMSVDANLYEAAKLDGANKFQTFIHVILPNIRTIVTLNVILSITGSISAFEPPYVITGGANGTGTFFVLMNTIAHTNQKVGLASAMAVFLLVVIIICYILQQLFFKFVFRKAEDEGNGYMSRKAMKNLKKEARRNG
ncbi:MAG: sugar ABC transporter permease [Saccharofermentans sp.]|jgi:multiple sugar transport system permease protein|nr:sugar ABC transporter permease [Mageeibacillus sp.]MCI1264580.1 sugar ABC transporter permease [Saccharofermentans sp.]MCI1275913.1 sugar ABC transporter permease [Saccharofermentans sp.]